MRIQTLVSAAIFAASCASQANDPDPATAQRALPLQAEEHMPEQQETAPDAAVPEVEDGAEAAPQAVAHAPVQARQADEPEAVEVAPTEDEIRARALQWQQRLLEACSAREVVGLFEALEVKSKPRPPQYPGDASRDEIHQAQLRAVRFVRNLPQLGDLPEIGYAPNAHSLGLTAGHSYLLFISRTPEGEYQGRQIEIVNGIIPQSGLVAQAVTLYLQTSCGGGAK